MADFRPEPPPPGRPGAVGQYDWHAIVKELTAKPGEWMLVAEKANRGLPSAIARKKMLALRKPGWTFLVTTRNNNKADNTADIWMSAEPVAGEEN